jgi:hypothetical protein
MITERHDEDTVRTNLEMSMALRRRIEVQAKIDRRQVKAQILVMLEEAAESREKRK